MRCSLCHRARWRPQGPAGNWSKAQCRDPARMGFGTLRSPLHWTRSMAMCVPPESSRGTPRSRFSFATMTTARTLEAKSPARSSDASRNCSRMRNDHAHRLPAVPYDGLEATGPQRGCCPMQRRRHFARQKRAIRWSSRDPLMHRARRRQTGATPQSSPDWRKPTPTP